MKKLLLFISLLLLRTGDTYSQWERTNGPEGSPINSVKIIGGQIYAATQSDGLYHSSDDGLSWQPLNTGIENEDVRTVVSKSGYLFAGTAKGVYRSSNNGNSWIAPLSIPI